MTPSDALFSLAEVSVAFLGFAAIASLFRQRDATDWRPDGRFWGMVGVASLALVFSLLPLPLLFAEVAPSVTWACCSGLLSLVTAGSGVIGFVLYVRDRAASTANLPLVVLLELLIWGSAGLLLANAVGAIGRSFWPYLAGLVWLLVLAVVMFVRLLWVWLERR